MRETPRAPRNWEDTKRQLVRLALALVGILLVAILLVPLFGLLAFVLMLLGIGILAGMAIYYYLARKRRRPYS